MSKPSLPTPTLSTPVLATRLVYATYPSLALAEAVGRRLVEAHLAACANILPAMVSIYRWEGAIERADEAVLLLKTTQALAPRVVEAVCAGHPYAVPAVVILPLEGGNPAFLGWIGAETADAGSDQSDTQGTGTKR